jgi:predicted nucleic acid-binding protein
LVKHLIDLNPYFRDGILSRCEVEGKRETEDFVAFASRLDDGEAVCMALAKNRNWSLATDDRLAIKLANEQGVQVLTTAQLLKQWSTHSNASPEKCATALRNIQRFARFVPRPGSPEADWWRSRLKD